MQHQQVEHVSQTRLIAVSIRKDARSARRHLSVSYQFSLAALDCIILPFKRQRIKPGGTQDYAKSAN
jgi:hypothetical protein